jgi:hypothetical protein
MKKTLRKNMIVNGEGVGTEVSYHLSLDMQEFFKYLL